FFLQRAVARFSVPDRDAAIVRLEAGNRLGHHPIAALDDVMAEVPVAEESGTTSRALWREHIRRARDRIGKPRVGWPSPGLARRDPRALRAAALLLVVVGFAAAGSDWSARLFSGIVPSLGLGSAGPVSLDAWIAPPSYTGKAPIFLHSGDITGHESAAPTKTLHVPVGSKVLARRSGGGADVLIDGKTHDFRPVGDKTEEIAYPVEKNARLAIKSHGKTIGAWNLEVIPDNPPAASFMARPKPTVGYALHIQFGAADDYGVESVKMALRRPSDKDDVLYVELPAARGQTSISGDHYQDLTYNPWAGEKVIGTIEARDALGQVGVSEPVKFVLPERKFTNPVAKKLVAMRKHLGDHPKDRASVKAGLAQLMDKPEAFNNDMTTALALGDAYWRLQYDKSDQAIDAVRDTLWKTAVHIENDDVTRARSNVRSLTEQLQKALAEGASQQKIDRLMNELRAALEKYLKAMQAQAQKQNGNTSQQAGQQAQGSGQRVTADQLRKMLDQARSMSQTGARQAASQLLSQMQSILENLSAKPMNAARDPGQKAMQSAISNLDKLARGQQSLMDETFQKSGKNGRNGRQGERGRGQSGEKGQGRHGSRGKGDSGSLSGLAGRQGGLQKELQTILQSLGGKGVKTPESLSQAGSSMGQAESALRHSDSDDALDNQGQALQALRNGIGELVNNANKQMGQKGQQAGSQGNRPGNKGGFATDHIDLPSGSDVQRSREILQELRKRSGEWQRPREERDYINRLLDVF
ncbi:MAG TPA: TIGR02302 family protein, partial [Alphaproteobacteria bacterium]|nr:TIGR02302 family protein [Alphaproteobacteria bacterium]